MSQLTTATSNGRFTPRQYRLAMYACLAVGFVGYLVGLELSAYLPALGIYWLAFLGFLAIWKGSPVTLYDERDEALERRAWSITAGVIGAVVILVGPALPAILDAGYDVPDLLLGALFGWAALFGVFAVVHTVVRYGPTRR